jgi:hypothetical protein
MVLSCVAFFVFVFGVGLQVILGGSNNLSLILYLLGISLFMCLVGIADILCNILYELRKLNKKE